MKTLLLLLALPLTSCVTLTPTDYQRIGEIINTAIQNHQPSGK